MLFLPQLLDGVDSVISTCGMCQRDQRARAKHGSVLKRSFITALWLHCSDGDFCSIEPPESDVTAVSAVCRYGGRGRRCIEAGLSVLTAFESCIPTTAKTDKV